MSFSIQIFTIRCQWIHTKQPYYIMEYQQLAGYKNLPIEELIFQCRFIFFFSVFRCFGESCWNCPSWKVLQLQRALFNLGYLTATWTWDQTIRDNLTIHDDVPPSTNKALWWGLINHRFPLIRPAITTLISGGVTLGGGWLTSHKPWARPPRRLFKDICLAS